MPSLGFIAISIIGLFGLATSAEVTMVTPGRKPLDVLAQPDNTGTYGIQTMHAALPKLPPGEYTVYVLLRDASVHCATHQDDAFDLPSITVIKQ